MSMQLYHYGNSVCAEKVRMTLSEKGVTDWENREMNLIAGDQFDPEYLKLNPKAVVPTLVHDGKVVVESSLICEYVDDIYPDPPLKPADPYERATMRLYPKAVDEGVHQAIGVISFSAMFMDRIRKLPPEQHAIRLGRILDLERRDRMIAVYHHSAAAPHAYRGVAAIEKLLQKTEAALADGRRWLCGDLFTLAEINVVPYLARLDYVGLVDLWLEDRPLSTAWYARIQERPSFQDEVVDRIDPAEWAEMREGGVKIRDQIRAHRLHYLETEPSARDH